MRVDQERGQLGESKPHFVWALACGVTLSGYQDEEFLSSSAAEITEITAHAE